MGKYQVEVVNCFSLNVRSGAGTGYKVIQWAQKGQRFTSSKQASGWYYLDEKKGYVKGTYVKVIKNLAPPKPAPKPVTPPKPAPKPPAKPAPKPRDYSAIQKSLLNGEGNAEGLAFKQLNADTRVPRAGESEVSIFDMDETVTDNVFHAADPDFDGPIGYNPQDPNMFDVANGGGMGGDGTNSGGNFGDGSQMDAGGMRMASTSASYPGANFNTANYSTSRASITDFALDYDFIKENMYIIKKNYNIIGETEHNLTKDLMTRFNRFKIPHPDYHLSKTFSHVFFTRPSLNLLMDKGGRLHDQFENDPLFYYLWNNNPDLVKSLTTSLSDTHDFHPFLSNAAASFEISDEFIKTIEHGATFTGYKVQYGRHNIESNTAGQFSVQYQDDANFNIYKTHKAWTEYISKVYRGVSRPTKNNIKSKILDYASSVYYFVCGPDGETILYWTKYFGVFPLNTPASAGSWAKGNNARLPEFGINYAYAMKEDFSPLSLAEFNANSSMDFTYRKIYEPELLSTGRSLSGAPFVESSKDERGAATYKLKFRM